MYIAKLKLEPWVQKKSSVLRNEIQSRHSSQFNTKLKLKSCCRVLMFSLGRT